MDLIKKRKLDENGIIKPDLDAYSTLMLTHEDTRKILDILTHDQLLGIVQNALLRHPDVLDAVRSFADRDVTHRKLFIRGLGWETTTEKLRSLFSSYGELDEAAVILDKTTGKSKGYGFITFKHIDGAMMALKEPSKRIDGRMTVTQLAAAGMSGGGSSGGSGGGVGGAGGVNNHNSVDVSMRKIYVANVPYDMPAERLLGHFSMYGEIEEGPLGFDKMTGKSKGFALFVYKTAEAARASLVDPVKNINGHQLSCKLANDGKRGKPPTPWGAAAAGTMGTQAGNQGNGDGIGATMMGGQYSGGQGGIGFSSGLGAGSVTSVPGLPVIGSQAAGSNFGVNGGYNSAVGGSYAGGSQFGGPIGTGYGGSGGGLGNTESGLGSRAGLGGAGAGFGGVASGLDGGGGGFGGVNSGSGGLTGAGGGMGAAVSESSLDSLPPTSTGMGSGDYPRIVNYSLSSTGYQGQHNHPAGSSAATRVPLGGGYPGMSPYY